MARFAPTLLEREAPLKALTEARARSADRGCIALVSGEAGIGKTELVSSFCGQSGDDVLLGCCDALFTPRALGPAHDIAARVGGDLLHKLESGASRPAIFSAFIEMLRATRDAVVVFEDLHWADEATLDLVKYLGRRIGETRVLLILTYRDDEVTASHPLRLVLGDLPRDRCVRVAVEPLTRNAVSDMLSGTLMSPASVHAATGGNPFYVTEVLAGGGVVSRSVSDAVLARVGRLGADARAVADVASVSPGGLEPAIARACVRGGAEGIAECEERGVLREVGGMLRFRHEIARLAILDALAPERRRLLNEQVLEMLRVAGVDGPMLARMAHHAEAAECPDWAVEYAVAAAKRAAALDAHREAAEHYACALRFSTRLTDAQRAELLDDFAWECHLTSRTDEGIAARESAIATWRRLGEHEREAVSLARLSHLLVIAGRNPDANRAVRAALEAMAPLPPGPTHVTVYRYHSYLRMLERDVDVAIADGEKALELARRFPDTDSEIHIRNTIGSAMLVNDDDRGIPYLQQSLALALAHDFDYHVANAHGNLGSGSGEVHRYGEAVRYLDDGIAWCLAHDLDNPWFYQTAWRALALLFLGRWSESAEAAQAVLGRTDASTISLVMAQLARGRLRARRGDPGVWEVLDAALALAEGTGTLQRLAPTRAARAEAAWLAGEDAAAVREAAAGDELARSKHHSWFVGELAYWQWKGGRAIDVPDYAARPYALQIAGQWREAADDWKARGCPYETARALSEGDTDARIEALRIYDELEASSAADRLRQALRASGVRRIPRGPRASTRAQPAGLTVREVQILGLIAEGLTNAEAGARLHISPKTVDHHVSAVLSKLGATSRREAVRAAEDAGVKLAAAPIAK